MLNLQKRSNSFLIVYISVLVSTVFSCNHRIQNSRVLDQNEAVKIGQSAIPCHRPRVFVDPNQNRIVTTALGQTLSQWDVKTGELVNSWSYKSQHRTTLFDVNILPDQKSVMLASELGVSVHDIRSGALLWSPEVLSIQKRKTYFSIGASTDGRIGITIGTPRKIDRWPDPAGIGMRNGEEETASVEYDVELELYDLEQKTKLGEFAIKDAFIHSAAITEDRRVLITSSFLRVNFYDISNPQTISKITSIEAREIDSDPSSGLFVSAAVSPDLRLLTIAMPMKVVLVDTQTKKLLPRTDWINQRNDPMFAIRHVQWSKTQGQIMATDLKSKVYLLNILTDAVVSSGNIDINSQQWRLFYTPFEDPYPAFAMSGTGDFFVSRAPQLPSSSPNCPGFQIEALKAVNPD